MGRKSKFTRVPKMPELLQAGVPREAIPTYCALADYGRNSDGLCWPKMETLASTLGCSVRTVQRHLSTLRDAGMIRFIERRRVRGRFSSYTYQLVHFLKFVVSGATTGHKRPAARRGSNKELERKRLLNRETVQYSPQEKRKRDAERRREGYGWLFG